MPPETQMQQLRELLYQRPSAESWAALCTLFDLWDDSENLELALEYADAHMTHWPDQLRIAPTEWITPVLSRHEPPPAWRLVRALQPPKSREQRIVLMVQSECMEHITRLDLQHTLMTDSSLRRCFHSRHIAQLEALSLSGQSVMSWDTLTILASTKAGKNLTSLDLSYVPLMGPDFGGTLREDAFPRLTQLKMHRCHTAATLLSRMKRNPGWRENLTHLDISRCQIRASQLRDIEDADFWASITHLDLSENDIHRGGFNALFGILEKHPITHINLDRANVHTECFRGLRGAGPNQLTHLSLRHNRIDDRCLSLLSRLPALGHVEQLWLQGNRITKRGLDKLIESPHLPDAAKKPYLESLSDGDLKDMAQRRKLRYSSRISRFQLMDLLLQR